MRLLSNSFKGRGSAHIYEFTIVCVWPHYVIHARGHSGSQETCAVAGMTKLIRQFAAVLKRNIRNA